MLRSQINQYSKILSRAMQFTSTMKSKEKLDELISTRSSKGKVIFNPSLSKNKLFDLIQVISIGTLLLLSTINKKEVVLLIQ